MSLVKDGLIIFILFLLFGASHSVLASHKIKLWIIKRLGNKIAFYRLFYNISSVLIFFLFWFTAPKPYVIIYDLHYPFDLIILVLQIFSLFGLLWASSKIDVKEFLGINQIKRFFNGTYKIEELDEDVEFIADGMFKYSRHPIYFFSMLFLGLRPSMDFFYLEFFILSIIYFIVGSYYEEKKLIERLGVRYLEYQKNVPRFIPYKIFINDFNK